MSDTPSEKNGEGPTPRTDKEAFDVHEGATVTHRTKYRDGAYVDADFARQLERELAAANRRIKEQDVDALILVSKAEAAIAEAAQSATAPLPEWVSDWTPEMMQAVEGYYETWQNLTRKHLDRDKVKADSWSAFHAWRAALKAGLDGAAKREGQDG